MSTVLTLLYVPGDRPERVAKALAGGADAVVVDLEDAVAPSAKEGARAILGELFSDADRLGGVQVQVRVNGADKPWHADDLAAIAALPAWVGVRLPKVESAQAVREVAVRLPGRPIHALLETALGVERAFEIASAPGMASIGLGETDLKADLRATDAGLGWARSRLVCAARAAGLPAPLMSVFANVTDLAALEASCREGRELGFRGRCAIHPRQLPVIREAFAPTPQEIERARLVVSRVEEATAAGVGALSLADGSFLDVAMVSAAREILAQLENP